MAVALLALVVAAGGTSYAAVQITSQDIKNGTIKVKDLNPRAVTALEGATGAAGQPGTPGAAGSARAYAYVESFGDYLVPERSKGVSSVTRVNTGKYCVALTDPAIDPETLAAVVSPEWENSGGDSNLAAYWVNDLFGCPAGTDVVVQTYEIKDLGSDTVEGVESDDVSFVVVIP
jgi:hypothetical protein